MTFRVARIARHFLQLAEKLRLDLCGRFRLRAGMDDTTREDLVSRLFALITARLENGAAEAVHGQGRNRESQSHRDLASQIQTLAEEIAAIAEAAGVLVDVRRQS